MATERSLAEVKARCKLLLGKLSLVELVQQSGSPTAAYIVVFSETNDNELAKAGRWFAVLRRDFPEEYNSVVRSILSSQATTARLEKESAS
jgi:hypothetical protein